jgi:predicted nucleic acid-binding protein
VTDRGVRALERICEVLPENPTLYPLWRRLVVQHQVKGVQVYDARLVAWMNSQAITLLITFNEGDFTRYPGIVAQTPEALIARAS